MWSWLFGKKLEDALYETKRIRVRGVRFTIQKVHVLNHLEGSRVLRQIYDIYKSKKNEPMDEVSEKKLRECYSQVLVAGVVKPKLSLKKTDGAVFVEDLFIDWEMVSELYERIMEFTYGKKKLKQHNLAGKG